MYIKLINEKKQSFIFPIYYSKYINWDELYINFYNKLNNEYDENIMKLKIKELWDDVEYLMSLSLIDINTYIKIDKEIPIGKIKMYISVDGQQFKLTDTYLSSVDKPVIKKIMPPAFHFSGNETVKIYGGSIYDMGNVFIYLTRCNNGNVDNSSDNIKYNDENNENSENIENNNNNNNNYNKNIIKAIQVKGIIENGCCIFKTPKFKDIDIYKFQLSLNGNYFTNPININVYGPITLESIEPKFGLITGDTNVCIKGSGLVNTGKCVVKLKINNCEAVYTDGYFDNDFIKFKTPIFPDVGKAYVEVSLNERDWICNYPNGLDSCCFTVYGLPSIKNIYLTGEYNNIIRIEGINFLTEIIPEVRFLPQDGESKGRIIDIEANLLSDEIMECKCPSIYSDNTIVEVTMDKIHYTKNKMSIVLEMIPIITEISPLWGPLCGGTICTIKGENFGNTDRIIVSFKSDWGGERRVLGKYMKDGTIQFITPSFIDKKNKTQVFITKVNVCLYGGSTFNIIKPLFPLKEFNYYKNIPLVWSVAPRNGPLYGKFTLTIETKNVEFTHDLYVILLHQTSQEKFVFVPDFLPDGKLQIKFPAFKKSNDGIVSVYVTYNGQDYSPEHPRASIEVWSSWIKKSGQKKFRTKRNKKGDGEDNLLKNIKPEIAEEYVKLKIEKEEKNKLKNNEEEEENPLWISPDSVFKLPELKDLKLESLNVNKQIQHLNRKDLEYAIENESAPIWVRRDAFYAPYMNNLNQVSLAHDIDEIEKYYPSVPSDDDLKIDDNEIKKEDEISNNQIEEEKDNSKSEEEKEDILPKLSDTNDTNDFDKDIKMRKSLIYKNSSKSPYSKKAKTNPTKKKYSYYRLITTNRSAYSPAPPSNRRAELYINNKRLNKLPPEILHKLKRKELLNNPFNPSEKTVVRRRMSGLVDDIKVIPDLEDGLIGIFRRYDENHDGFVYYSEYNLIMTSIFPELTDNDKSAIWIKYSSDDKFYYDNFAKSAEIEEVF